MGSIGLQIAALVVLKQAEASPKDAAVDPLTLDVEGLGDTEGGTSSMKYRKKIKKKSSRKLFKKSSGTKKINVQPRVSRGGIRL